LTARARRVLLGTMSKSKWGVGVALLAAIGLAVIACSGEADIGGSCDKEGQQSGECVSGSICGKDSDGAVKCLKQCADQAQCDTGFSCEGVSGTNVKGCRKK
jgi:hypothetical protein